MAFGGGDVFVEKIDFLGKLLLRKSTALEIKYRQIPCSDLIHVAPSPFVRCSVLTLRQPCEHNT